MLSLWPMTTPGTPENVVPATSNGHFGPTSRQCSPICSQMPGMAGARCGSLASNGSPLSVWSPDTTQELLPMPSPVPSSCGISACIRATDRSCGATARRTAGASGGGRAAPDDGWAAGSKRPDTMAPRSRIGWCSSAG